MCYTTAHVISEATINSRLLVVRFWRSRKFYEDFLLPGSVPLTPTSLSEWHTHMSCMMIMQRICVYY